MTGLTVIGTATEIETAVATTVNAMEAIVIIAVVVIGTAGTAGTAEIIATTGTAGTAEITAMIVAAVLTAGEGVLPRGRHRGTMMITVLGASQYHAVGRAGTIRLRHIRTGGQ